MGEAWQIAIVSYKRAGNVTTLDHVEAANVWVPESQRADYEAAYPGRVIAIPDEKDGHLSKKRNAVLDGVDTPWVIIMDDDITGFFGWEGGIRRKLTPPHLTAVIAHHFGLASELGVRLWGMNQNSDPLSYYVFRPLAFLAAILGPFTGHLSPTLRYDETLPCGTKEDYDFWLQNIYRHRKTLRTNRYHYTHGHALNPGGQATIRTMALEKAEGERLHQKWGKCYRMYGSSGAGGKKGRNVLNSRAIVPIPGV